MTAPNPLVPGFNPDPSVTRVGDTYYLVTSTFEYLPGIPIYASEDFVDWRQIGNVITRPEQGALDTVATGGGVWAPTIRHRDGRFYVIVSIAMGRGCVLFSTQDPSGEWDDGLALPGVAGIDPDLAWDDDGVAIVTYSALTLTGPEMGAHGGVAQVSVDLMTGETLDGPRSLWAGTGLKFPEAPHIYRRGEFWYLMIAEGGTERGHGESVARATTPRGPYEGGPNNPFLSAKGTNRPVQNTGHGDLVRLADGTDALVLLGVRPRGMTQAFAALGRETFWTTITWVDGWPVAEPVRLAPRAGETVQDFTFDALLDPGWLAIRRPPGPIVDLAGTPGSLTLRGEGTDLDDVRPVFVGRRQLNQTASIETTVDASAGSGGLAVRYDEQTAVSVLVTERDGGTLVTARLLLPMLTKEWPQELAAGPVTVRIASVPPSGEGFGLWAQTSDIIRLVAVQGGAETLLAEVDGRFLSAESAASFTGRVFGLFAVTGSVTFDGLHYRGTEE